MNRFIIDKTPEAIAQQLCDQHICKMVLEEAQMLCTAVWFHRPDIHSQLELYKPCHINTKYHEQNKAVVESGREELKVTGHPCTLWALKTRINYRFAVRLMKAMNDEYMWRYPIRSDRTVNTGHKSMRHFDALVEAEKYIPDVSNFMTPHPQCFSGHDDCKTNEDWPIVAYRAFYKVDKSSFARYNKGRNKPEWMITKT